jgi:XRE family transcriptional regulator, regulator of sulfur utilization
MKVDAWKNQVHPFQREKLTGRQLVFSDGDLFVLSAPAGTRTEFEPELHGATRETCLVVSGRVMVTVADQTVSLGPGEAVRFKAMHPHHLEIMEDAVLVLLSTPL